MAEFKIGRLRFTWAGEWETGVVYKRDSVILHRGKTYVCLVPHTSSEFNDDLNHTLPGGAITPYWNLMLDGKQWEGPWITGTLYSTGDIVLFGGTLYYCNTAHTSNSFEAEQGNWTTYIEGYNWNTVWQTNHVYGLGDIVKYGGIVYRCTAAHTSASTTALGLEDDLGSWAVLVSGVAYTNAWTSGYRYKLNDLVKNGPDLWICSSGHTSTGTFDPAKWTLWMPGFEFSNEWNNSSTYQPGDVVSYGGYSYVSNIVNNTNNTPSTDSVSWSILSQGFRFRNEWSSSTSYKIGDAVRLGGVLYEAISDSSAQNPGTLLANTTYTALGSSGTTFKVGSTTNVGVGSIVRGAGLTLGQTVVSVIDSNTVILDRAPDGTLTDAQSVIFNGVNHAYWKLIVPSVYWRNLWNSASLYAVGDLTVWKNVTYICITDHSSSIEAIAEPDLSPNLWAPYVEHARKNALTSIGDLETYSNGVYIPVPIGTQDYSLRITDGLPEWKHLNTVAKVYYVAPAGLDTTESGWGLTWDKPWKTIKFAADTVLAGSTNLDIKAFLETNKNWLTTEMYQWMLYQVDQENTPFTQESVFDETKTIRDAKFVVDAVINDITQSSNSQTVATALSYFSKDSTNKFITDGVAAQMPYFIAALSYLKELVDTILINQTPTNYQTLNGIELKDQVSLVALGYTANLPVIDAIDSLLDITITALTDQDTAGIPVPNAGIATTIMIKTGTYSEQLPITLGENVALYGDELRSVVVQPLVSINTTCTLSEASTNLFTVETTDGLEAGMPLQFAAPLVSDVPTPFGGITSGQTYYVVGSTITATQFSLTSSIGSYLDITGTNSPSVTGVDASFDVTVNDASYDVTVNFGGSGYNQSDVIVIDGSDVGGVSGVNDIEIIVNTTNGSGKITSITSTSSSILAITDGSGVMAVYAGDCIKDMFYMRNASSIRNMTLRGLFGSLTTADEFTIKRPTGGAYTSLDPGTGPSDTRTWIYRRSPYVQNVTAFGQGCAALKIDGNLHNGGNKSMVANDYTHILSDGIGVWCTGPGALTEVISVFSYYGYTGYMAEAGGRIRAANGNSSYGTYGVIATGYDVTEIPATGTIDNQSSQVQASVQSAFGTTANLLRLNFSNAGSGYNSSTTNLLAYSNNFLGGSWSTDGNLTFAKVTTAPTGLTEGWTFTGTGASTTSYIYQNISIPAAGKTYVGLTATNISGSGGTGANTPATFDVTVTSTGYSVVVNVGGSGYVAGNQLLISGGQLGGVNSVNDCVLTVEFLSGSSILTVTVDGTVPVNSDLNYTLSVYIKEGTAPSVDLYGIFSGSSTVSSMVNYNFITGVVTPNSADGGFLPTEYGCEPDLSNGWYRLWVTVNDTTGLNTQLQYRLYPKGYNGNPGTYTYFYGSQVELSRPTYSPSFYLEVPGTTKYTAYANYNISGAGTGVLTVGDETRSGSVFNVRITDTGLSAGGSGYLTSSNNAQSGNTSYVQLAQSDTNTNSNYTGMRVFIQSGTGAGQYGYISYYDEGTKNASVLKESFSVLGVTNTTDTTNLITLDTPYNTETLYVDQPIQFIPTYYTTSVSATSLAQVGVSATTGGTVNTMTVSNTLGMTVGMGITFSGTLFGSITPGYVYYVYAILDTNTIQITEQPFGNIWPLTTATGSMVANFTSNTSYISASTLNMVVNYPIQFTGSALGGLSVGTTYYINDVIDINHFSIASSLVDVTVTATNPSTAALSAPTANLIPLNPIVFTSPTFGNIVDGTKYYISKIIDSASFKISSTIITATATQTEATSNLITVGSTSGFVTNQPIKFVGTSFGGITAETIYYILAINNVTTFTVSQTPGGGAITLSDATGSLSVVTCPAAYPVTSGSGSMSGTSTSTKITLSLGSGSMNATFSTSLFGGVELGTTYYVKTIDAGNNQITITDSEGGVTEVTLATKSGAMNIAAVGWDHINPGTQIASVLDNSSVYFIEPKTTFTDPVFDYSPVNEPIQLAVSTSYVDMAVGKNYWIAIPDGNSTAAGSADGNTWEEISLPTSASWSGIAYGNGFWVIISANGAGNSVALYSKSNGQGWRSTTLPSQSPWIKVVYGNGRFVAISSDRKTAYSTNYGTTWIAGSDLPVGTWTSLTFGNGKFVAISDMDAAYSTDGSTWTNTSLPVVADWSDIAFGNNLFHAVSSTTSTTAYSTDGITWLSSNLAINASKIRYGQGVFVALADSGGDAWTSEGTGNWKYHEVPDQAYGAVCFGFNDVFDGIFVSLSDRDTGTVIIAGCRTKARAIVTSGTITSLSIWEPGSGYDDVPEVTFTDPNVTDLAVVVPRLSNGTLSSPSFINRGTGYNTTSTAVSVTGNGYADTYQTGLTITINNLTRLPNPGDNLTIDGVDEIYKVTSAYAVYGTAEPNLQANVSISPAMTAELSPPNGAAVSIRSLYSQARLTNHDFLNIGYGDFETSNYPGFPDAGYGALYQNQTVEVDYGRVFYTSTDQDGNFKVGNLFGVQQATGIVTLSASQFGLTGLETLSLGGIAVGGSAVIINQFSTDGSFTANSDAIVPTQKAIKTYLTNRLSQGGSNTFTGQFVAGSVVVGGPNKIYSAVPNGTPGSVVKMGNKATISSVDGNMAAMDFFIRHSSHKTRA